METISDRAKKKKVKEAVHTVMAMAVICGVFLLIIGTVLARPILMAINTPDEVLPLAMLYLRIYFVGMPFVWYTTLVQQCLEV